jgi:hypothetical protein
LTGYTGIIIKPMNMRPLARIWGSRNQILSRMAALLSVLSCGRRKVNGPLIGAHDIVDLGEFDRHGNSCQPIMPVDP